MSTATQNPLRTEDAITDAAKAVLDEITKQHTGFTTFRSMVEAQGSYRPTIYVSDKRRPELKLLADAYDKTQELRGDPRRAYRVNA